MARANEYTVKRIEEDVFELWLDDKCLATLTKEEAWPVMVGQVHPGDIVIQTKPLDEEGKSRGQQRSNPIKDKNNEDKGTHS